MALRQEQRRLELGGSDADVVATRFSNAVLLAVSGTGKLATWVVGRTTAASGDDDRLAEEGEGEGVPGGAGRCYYDVEVALGGGAPGGASETLAVLCRVLCQRLAERCPGAPPTVVLAAGLSPACCAQLAQRECLVRAADSLCDAVGRVLAE
eukprot:m51a1_g1966 hypothetical protein (152) ;mRNA; r:1081589-1082103